MNQCLRCSKSCIATAVFCDECRSLLRGQLQHGTSSNTSSDTPTHLALVSERSEVHGDPLERITSPYPIVKATPPPPPSLADYIDIVDQAIDRLNEAAQRIAEVEQQSNESSLSINRRIPRASRLKPIRDISADIQRESTPLPLIAKPPESEQGEDLARRLPDLWPWLQDSDTEEGESDNWGNSTDPLLSRHFPSSAEAAQIEEEDIRRAAAEGITTAPFPVRRVRSARMSILFRLLAVMALLALLADGILLLVAFNHPQHHSAFVTGDPTLTLSSNLVSRGQTIKIFITHFPPLTSVLLTRDIEEAIQTDQGASLVNVNSNGAATALVTIDAAWIAGFHNVTAEDVKTRDTANAQLRINEGPTPPAHLLISSTSLNLGPDIVGANTIQSLTLSNGGGGSITWSASSNVPWLLVSPTHGVFSEDQTITLGGQRANLKPRDYTGTLTINSNVAPPQHISVEMTVRPIPPNAGPVITVTPPVLSFAATDGGANPGAQVLTVSNPGSRRLSWSLTPSSPVTNGSSGTGITSSSLFNALGSQSNWLSSIPTSGTVPPGGSTSVQVNVNSKSLLPNVYTGTLVFTAIGGALDSPQSISVSLTIQPRCSLLTSLGSLSFTAVQGKSNPSTQALGLSATPSCPGLINWQAFSSSPWLTVTPASGQLRGVAGSVTSVGVNTNMLAPRQYSGSITFATTTFTSGASVQSTQTVMVQLAVQQAPPPAAPVIGASPLTLNFSTIQGQSNPATQVVTITNTGGSTLLWHTMVNTLASSWLAVSPTGGSLPANQSGPMVVNINTTGLTPGTYVGQIVLNGNDASNNPASGNPQTITVNLVIQPPCSLGQPSSSSLSFSAIQGNSDPSAQTITVTGSGSCVWPLKWSTSLTSSAPWLTISPASGSLSGSGQSASITISASIGGLTPGVYSTHVSLTATDSAGTQALGSPQDFSVTLNILQPCALRVPSTNLTFNVAQGQVGATENLSFSETGNCGRPVSWNVSGDAGSSSWLVLSSTSGTDFGRGSTVGVSVNLPTTLTPGTYVGKITISVTGNGGAPVISTPQTVPVTLNIMGFTISGTVMACPDVTCSTSTALPGAAVSLMNGTTQVATTTADASGNYTFTNVALGAYTISASGSDSNGTHYTGTLALTVIGNQSGLIVNIPPG